MQDDKIRNILGQHRVKMHVFEPSRREIWTVVGKKEYWVHPEREFCSCPGYYFDKRGKKWCYHLEALKSAKREGGAEAVPFADEEYVDFISGLLSDM